jgi:hypothetical protein
VAPPPEFKLNAPLRLNPAVSDALAAVVQTLNGPGASAADGTLASRRSLLKQSGKQVGKDASASLDNAKDAVKDLLKRK